MVKIGNGLYFLYIFIGLFVLFLCYFFLKKKSQAFQYRFILILSFLNLALHFLKLLFPPYIDGLPTSIRKITFENICAISTLLVPLVLSLKKVQVLNNYFFFISLVGGIGALIYPTDAFNKPAFCFDTIRFYYCHMTLMIIPLLCGMLKLYVPNYKKAYQIPILFILIEGLILLNEFILLKVGLISPSISDFFSREIRNSSFVFGPLPAFDSISKILTIFTPSFFKTNLFHIEGLDTFYFPVLWLLIPAFIYLPIVYELLILPFTFKQIQSDIRSKKSPK